MNKLKEIRNIRKGKCKILLNHLIDNNIIEDQDFSIEELPDEIRKTFGNGGSLTRNDKWSRLGIKFVPKYHKNKIISMRYKFINSSVFRQYIPNTIRKKLKNKTCVNCGTKNDIEIDHKNGRKNESVYTINDFQPLCGHCNKRKREVCRKCKEFNIRYDAKKIGFTKSFYSGSETYENCYGCYWYDIIEFKKHLGG